MSEENGGNDRPLTGKQAAFVREYPICLNGTEAARRAKYEGNDTTLAVTAHRLLRNAKIRAAIDAETERLGVMPKAEVLLHWTDMARSDIADALNSMGAIDPLEAVRRGKSHLVKRFKTKVTTIDGGDPEGQGKGDKEIIETEVEMYSRENALDKLGRFYGLLNEKSEITGDVTIRIVRDDYRPPSPDAVSKTD